MFPVGESVDFEIVKLPEATVCSPASTTANVVPAPDVAKIFAPYSVSTASISAAFLRVIIKVLVEPFKTSPTTLKTLFPVSILCGLAERSKVK